MKGQKKEVWDVLTLPVAEAKRILSSQGIDVKIRLTGPPQDAVGKGELRVIRQKQLSSNLHELVVVYEDFSDPLKGGGNDGNQNH